MIRGVQLRALRLNTKLPALGPPVQNKGFKKTTNEQAKRSEKPLNFWTVAFCQIFGSFRAVTVTRVVVIIRAG